MSFVVRVLRDVVRVFRTVVVLRGESGVDSKDDFMAFQWCWRRGRSASSGLGRDVSPSSWGSARIRRRNGAGGIVDGEERWERRVCRRACWVGSGRAKEQPWKRG